MKKVKRQKLKVKSSILILVIAVFLFGLPAAANAFWPFDLFTKSSSTGNQTKFPDVIQKIIDRFKLDSGEVQKVMEETQNEKQQEMKARREAKLNEAVKAGIITEEQKTALLNKEAEWQEKQQELMRERQQWMEQSGIDFHKLAPYGGFGGLGFGRGFGRGDKFGRF